MSWCCNVFNCDDVIIMFISVPCQSAECNPTGWDRPCTLSAPIMCSHPALCPHIPPLSTSDHTPNAHAQLQGGGSCEPPYPGRGECKRVIGREQCDSPLWLVGGAWGSGCMEESLESCSVIGGRWRRSSCEREWETLLCDWWKGRGEGSERVLVECVSCMCSVWGKGGLFRSLPFPWVLSPLFNADLYLFVSLTDSVWPLLL